MVQSLVVWIFLIAGGVCDFRKKEIPILLPIGGMLAGAVIQCMEGTAPFRWLFCLLPGACMLFLAFFTGEKVGYGDGLFLCGLGLLEGCDSCLRDLMLGLVCAFPAGLVLLVRKKGNRETQIPFLPFLLGGHVLQCLTGGL